MRTKTKQSMEKETRNRNEEWIAIVSRLLQLKEFSSQIPSNALELWPKVVSTFKKRNGHQKPHLTNRTDEKSASLFPSFHVVSLSTLLQWSS